MEMYLQALWLRIRDGAQACWAATLPSDRPSAIFAVFNCMMNGGLLVWSFSVVLSHPCSRDDTLWIGFGMAHCYVNMFFAVGSMMRVRRKIACGIAPEVSQWRLFYADPFMVAYALYLVFEIVWMIAGAGVSKHNNSPGVCIKHITMQILFLVLYLLVGVLLIFQITFVSERWRRPRWRNFAAMRWDYLHNTEGRRTVRWHDEQHAEAGDEPVQQSRAEGRRREDTERTSTRDYASIRDDVTTATSDVRDSRWSSPSPRTRSSR